MWGGNDTEKTLVTFAPTIKRNRARTPGTEQAQFGSVLLCYKNTMAYGR